MKKSLLIGLMLSSTLLLAACGNKEENAEPDTTVTENPQQNVLPPENEITMTCPEAIQDYLNNANLEGEGDITIQANDSIVVDYIGRLEDGSVFDTSVETVAKACGSYNVARDYNEGLAFTAGAGQMIPGFDAAVIGMKINQTKTATLSPAEAYGEYDATKINSYSTEGVDISGLQVGMQIYAPNGSIGTITEITDKEITLNSNHELAGKSLIFDITIKSIN
jgi:FKBP-type peptidyl-prolyl cis-trans isomerase 2